LGGLDYLKVTENITIRQSEYELMLSFLQYQCPYLALFLRYRIQRDIGRKWPNLIYTTCSLFGAPTAVRSFVTLDPSNETLCWSNALTQGEEGNW